MFNFKRDFNRCLDCPSVIFYYLIKKIGLKNLIYKNLKYLNKIFILIVIQ